MHFVSTKWYRFIKIGKHNSETVAFRNFLGFPLKTGKTAHPGYSWLCWVFKWLSRDCWDDIEAPHTGQRHLCPLPSWAVATCWSILSWDWYVLKHFSKGQFFLVLGSPHVSSCWFFSLDWTEHFATVFTFQEFLLITKGNKFLLVLVLFFNVEHYCVSLVIPFSTTRDWAIMDVKTQVLGSEMLPAGPIIWTLFPTLGAVPRVKRFSSLWVLATSLFYVHILFMSVQFFCSFEISFSTKALVVSFFSAAYHGLW